jgi:hypothetical protein
MKIHELVYEIRKLAREEQDPVKRDLFYQCAKSMEIMGNLSKIGDLVVAEQRSSDSPASIDEDQVKWSIDSTTIQMMNDHLNALVHYGFLSASDRWPYENEPTKKFVGCYKNLDHSVKDSNIE